MKKLSILIVCVSATFALDPLFTTSTTSSPFISCKNITANAQLTLIDAVNLALCNDPKTQKAYAASMQAAANLGVSRSGYLPNVSATATQPVFNDPPNQNKLNGSGGLNLSMLLYDFGQTAYGVESAQKTLESANFTAQNAIQNVFLKTIKDYCTVIAAQEALDSAKFSEKLAHESFLEASTKFDIGVVAVADKLQAKTAWSQAVLIRVGAEGDIINAKAVFASNFGNDVGKTYSLSPLKAPNTSKKYSAEVQKLIDEAIKNRPDLKSAKADVESAKASATQIERSYMPTISIGGQLGYADSYLFPPPNNSNISLNINIPIFSGFSTYYKAKAAKEQVNILQSTYEDSLRQAILSVYQYHNQLVTKTNALQTADDLLESATQSEKVARGRYEAGVGKMIDLLSAQSALQSAKQQKIQAELDWRIAKASLAYAMGALSVDEIKKETQEK